MKSIQLEFQTPVLYAIFMSHQAHKKSEPLAGQKVIREYSEGCRSRVPGFLENHYSFDKILNIQKQHLRDDIWKLPLNSLWAMIYLSFKKIAESLDKVGWSLLLYKLEYIPTGFKTSLQVFFEKQIATELFQVQQEHDIKMDIVKKELKKYAIGRTVIASFSATITSLVLGWLLFGRGNLDVLGIVNGLSESFARDRAASSFIFGKSLGKTYYNYVRPDISWFDIVLASSLFVLVLAMVSMGLSILYFPIRKKLGLEEKKLNKMISEIEERLVIELHKSN